MNENTTMLVVTAAVCVILLVVQIMTSRRYRRKRQFAIAPGGEKRLEIRSTSNWRRLAVYFDGALVGEVTNKVDLFKGVEFPLPNQVILRIQLRKIYLTWAELQVWCDGQPVHDFSHISGSNLKVVKAGGGILLVGIMPLIWLGTVIFVRLITTRQLFFLPVEIPFILAYLGWSILYFTLAYFCQKGSLFAMGFAVVLFIIDGVLGTVMYYSTYLTLSAGSGRDAVSIMAFAANLVWGIGFLAFHIFVLAMMIPGLGVMLARKRETTSTGPNIRYALFVLILIGGLVAAYFLVNSGQADTAALNNFYNQAPSTLNWISPGLSIPTGNSKIQSTQPAGICWTQTVTGFSGNRSQAWATMLDAPTRNKLPYEQFVQDTLTYNPQLIADGYIFIGTKKYLFPRQCP